MIRLQFVLGRAWSSRAIAWFSAGTRGGVSHVDCILPDGTLLGARSDKVGGQPSGVRIRPADYERWRRKVIVEIPTTKTQEKKFYKFVRAQLGKPYDKLTILGYLINRNWRDDDSWVCSELHSAGMEKARIIPTLFVPANKIRPGDLATVSTAIGGKITLDVIL